MADRKAELLDSLAAAVIEMDEVRAVDLAHEALAAGIDPYAAISEGLSRGMAVVSEKYDNEEYFVPEILLCSDAMYAAIAVLKPHVAVDSPSSVGKIVIGVIEGDTHDIGKNIVKIMLDAAGFEMHDLGRDVAVARFIEEAQAQAADIIAISTLMSTTREGMGRVVEGLKQAGVRDEFKVLIGGPPVSPAYCKEIGADAYGANPSDAIRIAGELIGGGQ